MSLDKENSILWGLLYDEEPAEFIDPNVEANRVRIRMDKEEQSKDLRSFRDGPGKTLFAQWDERIKTEILVLLRDPRYRACSCPAAQLITQINTRLDIWLEAELAIRKEK